MLGWEGSGGEVVEVAVRFPLYHSASPVRRIACRGRFFQMVELGKVFGSGHGLRYGIIEFNGHGFIRIQFSAIGGVHHVEGIVLYCRSLNRGSQHISRLLSTYTMFLGTRNMNEPDKA